MKKIISFISSLNRRSNKRLKSYKKLDKNVYCFIDISKLKIVIKLWYKFKCIGIRI